MSNQPAIIRLNVRGTIMDVKSTTVNRFSGEVLAKIIHDPFALKDRDGNIYIDSDPEIFHRILDIHRDGKIPKRVTGILKKEIKYWFPDNIVIDSTEMKIKRIASRLARRYYYKGEHRTMELSDQIEFFYIPEYLGSFCLHTEENPYQTHVNQCSLSFNKSLLKVIAQYLLEKGESFPRNKEEWKNRLDQKAMRERISSVWQEMGLFLEDFDSLIFMNKVCEYTEKIMGEHEVKWIYRTHTCSPKGKSSHEDKFVIDQTLELPSRKFYTKTNISNVFGIHPRTIFGNDLNGIKFEDMDPNLPYISIGYWLNCPCFYRNANFGQMRSLRYIVIYPKQTRKVGRSISIFQ